MQIDQFLEKLQNTPEAIEFTDTMAVIDSNYNFTPTDFDNGTLHNQSGENQGSCKLFAFALAQQLSQQQTLACFGHYYRDHVLGNPDGDDHQNIRQFINSGWDGIKFPQTPLVLKG